MSKRDNAAVEVDPYAAYYEQYANSVAETQQQPVVPFTQYVSEKQGFAGAMENALGPDAGVSSFSKMYKWILANVYI